MFNSARKGGYDIFKMDPLGHNVAGLTTYAYAGEPAWSQDNMRIAMVRERLDASKVSHTDIYLINADGTNGHWARATPSPYNLRYPSWSPDGSRILLTIQQLGKPYLATLILATGQIKFVTSAGIGVQGNYPSYNPGRHEDRLRQPQRHELSGDEYRRNRPQGARLVRENPERAEILAGWEGRSLSRCWTASTSTSTCGTSPPR